MKTLFNNDNIYGLRVPHTLRNYRQSRVMVAQISLNADQLQNKGGPDFPYVILHIKNSSPNS